MDILENWVDRLPWFETSECDNALARITNNTQGSVSPSPDNVFNAYTHTMMEDMRVVILGTVPYQTDATGLAYACSNRIPKSLEAIFTELQLDYGSIPPDGNLIGWAEQGVMLLNCRLTNTPDIDWYDLIDETLWSIGQATTNTVFILLGNAAIKRRVLVGSRHLVIIASDPTSTSGFYGERIFTKTNQYLSSHDRGVIDWFK